MGAGESKDHSGHMGLGVLPPHPPCPLLLLLSVRPRASIRFLTVTVVTISCPQPGIKKPPFSSLLLPFDASRRLLQS